MISIEKSETNKKEHWKSETNLSQTMISIEKSETDKKKEHWKSKTNLFQTMNCVLDWANAKSMAKIWYKFHGPRQI